MLASYIKLSIIIKYNTIDRISKDLDMISTIKKRQTKNKNNKEET